MHNVHRFSSTSTSTGAGIRRKDLTALFLPFPTLDHPLGTRKKGGGEDRKEGGVTRGPLQSSIFPMISLSFFKL